MPRQPRGRRARTQTALLAVFLLLAGLTAMIASVWMQERQIQTGADAYDALIQKMKPSMEAAKETAKLPEPATASPSSEPSDAPEGEAATPQNETPLPSAPAEKLQSPAAAKHGLTGADLAACQAINSDFIGWLQIPGTTVDYPVVLTGDVAHYLTHTFEGQENVIGCLFSLDKTDYETPSRNIAVYGHHMRRSRAVTMFQPLHEYKDAGFCASHSTICFDMLYRSCTYTVFAVLNKRESDWDASTTDFASDADFLSFVERARALSFYDTGVEVSAGDHILTLITCDRKYNSETGQLVVMAVQNEAVSQHQTTRRLP